MKYSSWIIAVFILLVLSVGCSAPQQQDMHDKKLLIATTFFPLYDLTRSILGNKGTAFALVPAGAEPHEYEASPQDILQLNKADGFVTMGVAFSAFEDTLKSSVGPQVKIIDAGLNVTLLPFVDAEKGNLGGLDSHIWLSPKNAKKMAANILEGISSVDAENARYYESNAQILFTQLDTLDAEFKEGLSACKLHVVLVNHNAFSYLGKDYGFTTMYITGLEPEAEPSPSQLKEIVDQARKQNIKYVLYEDLVDPRVAQTIADEVHATVLALSPLEGSSDPKDTYVSLMEKNLKTLRTALACP